MTARQSLTKFVAAAAVIFALGQAEPAAAQVTFFPNNGAAVVLGNNGIVVGNVQQTRPGYYHQRNYGHNTGFVQTHRGFHGDRFGTHRGFGNQGFPQLRLNVFGQRGFGFNRY